MLEICPSCKDLVDHYQMTFDGICEACEAELGEQSDSQLEPDRDRENGEII